MTRSQPPRPPCGRTPFLVLFGRVAALNSGFRHVRRCAQQSACVDRPAPHRSRPPVPPASRNGRATARAERERGRAGGFFRGERAGSAENTGISSVRARKSLILEASAAPCRIIFAPIYAPFAPSPNFAPVAAAPFFLLSNSLKKKKKEYGERQGISLKSTPRVMPVLPLLVTDAYFLSPESEAAAPHNQG